MLRKPESATEDDIKLLCQAILERDKTRLIELGSFEDTAGLPRYLKLPDVTFKV